MRLLKTIHSWLGVIVLPWVLIIGLTGLFLNHEGLVMGVLDQDGYDEDLFDTWPAPRPMTPEEARALAESLFPGKSLSVDPDTSYHGREAAIFDTGEAQVIVALKTGHYWIKTDSRRITHAPDGTVLETRIYWESLFKRLHVRGWLTSTFGTWLADITATAMVVFGFSGIVLFLNPRLRRLRNRRRMRSMG
ncbi:PepSY-associated TM helix domain-containing protein [Rhodobacter sp. SY28-1]|uniref:PepSY-associated TM helix domain-containing protein n=1 Tax=Rhodobacter sp. SY28-1 TaxID=2562317 RepID=UPI0010BFE6B8|nr:PepSY-associated TM helix domain-containing protein [Rhodobacter sp. SY28-1]